MKNYSKILICIIGLFYGTTLLAQHSIGHRSLTLNDPSRARDIPCHFYYPAATDGDNVAVSSGQFPFIVFGHGFSIGYDAYMNFVDELVPLGFIICFPTTEGGLSPNHETFGLDLKFLANEIKAKGNTDPAFFLYQKLTTKSAIMGHSMGGGSSFLAAASNTNITTLVNFAAAETDVSAIAAASNVTVPVLVFIGEKDGVTPPVDHQIPMYNAIPAGCKGKITVLGGGHCYFANYNLACSTGELFTSPQPTISRDDQHLAVFNVLIPYLNWMLKDQGTQRTVFETTIAQTSVYNAEFSCSIAQIEEENVETFVYPNPFGNELVLSASDAEVEIVTIEGKSVKTIFINGDSPAIIDTSNLTPGLYIMIVKTEVTIQYIKIIKQ